MSKRKYTPTQQAKRDKKFREQLAQKQNPVRFALALPTDVRLEDLDWNADHLEQIAAKLSTMKKRWEQEDDQRRRQRCAEVMAAVEEDKRKGRL